MKNKSRIGVHYTIDKKIAKNFNTETKKKAINMSALIQQFMEKWINDNKKEK